MRESMAFVVGCVPPVAFLLYSQWSMFGNAILPAQSWMPAVNYTDEGWRGFDWPSLDLYALNLFDPSYGMYTFGPILLLGLIPVVRYAAEDLILPKRERWFVIVSFLTMLTFCAANQYARMQFNTGFRYLIPLVPFVFLAASDHLVRLRAPWRIVLSVLTILHTWVLTIFRESVVESWRLFFTEGPSLPWLRVLAMTLPEDTELPSTAWLAVGVLSATAVVCIAIWKYGARQEKLHAGSTGERSPAA